MNDNIYQAKRAAAGKRETANRTDRPATGPPLSKHAFRINDACWKLSIGRTSLYNMIKAGRIKAIVISGRTLIPRTEIERLTGVKD
jgi:hypothetical protein